VLVITPDFPPARGGIQVLAQRLATGLTGFQTRVVTLDCAGARPFDATAGLATRRVRAGRGLGAGRNVALGAAALLEALRFRPQLTLSVHIVASPAAAGIRRALGARTVQYFHAKEIGNRPRLAAFAARQAHASIAVSSYTAGLIAGLGPARAGGSKSSTTVNVIPPGVDLPSDPSPRAAGRPTFVTVSRLEDRYKGHDVLIGALALVRAKVPDVEWIVIGDGPLRPELEALARSYGVADAVRFLGLVSDEQRDRWLRRANLLAMPSRLPGGGLAGEGFGIVYLEAGAYGKPVVAGNVAGALDAVADGESGLLVDPVDPHAVADAIARLLLDRELARRLGSAGAARARDFAWPVIAGRVEAVLLEQLRVGGGRAAA
jgi:phosphatidyl-myo-inositol dimannoside synthase